jgi:type IV pilus assembly protein PilE
MARAKASGFSLIELMIVVAVVAILATIAYPSYQDHIRKSRRVEAQAVLIDIQLRQERYRANNTTYGTLEQIGGGPSGVITNFYTFTVSDPPQNNTYTVTATAIAGTSQAHDSAGGTSCSPLTIDQDSAREPAACW